METLWSMSTTIREAERIKGFLATANEMEGLVWDFDSQCRFQILLIKNHEYLNDTSNTQTKSKLSDEQIQALADWDKVMSYEMAESIFNAKQYRDPDMRGRQSMSPLVKLGLVFYTIIDGNRIIRISDVGKKLLNDEIKFEDFMLDALLKHQYPNPADTGFSNWNTKPFINTLRLIKKVNDLCISQGLNPVGISKTEFGIFALSLKSYSDVDTVAKTLLDFRKELMECQNSEERNSFIESFINDYLADFNNPQKNCWEYTDNMVRYLRLTKYIYIRGKYEYAYIDLEPRRMTEIESILSNDNGSANEYTLQEWYDYMGTYGAYQLPFETQETLNKIVTEILQEISELEEKLQTGHKVTVVRTTVAELKQQIEELRIYRTRLQNLEIKQSVKDDNSKINEAIEALDAIVTHNKAKLAKKYSIELEKWANVALNIIDNAELIKPNAPVGDDNEPIYTAPSGVPDIECLYDSFGSICEVTTLTSRDQWYNEGQPVMRHLRDFENTHSDLPNYCLFIAPSLHQDTINTFYMSVRYEYEGYKQKIIPITIRQLNIILKSIKILNERNKAFSNEYLKNLYDLCVDISNVSNSSQWMEHINESIESWSQSLCA